MVDFLAKSDLTSDVHTPDFLFGGEADIVTEPATLITGQNLAQRTVVARIAASGKLTQWAPAASDGSQYAVGILQHAINATSADKACVIYTGGIFNIDALVWPGGATAAQKAVAFDRTNIGVRALG